MKSDVWSGLLIILSLVSLCFGYIKVNGAGESFFLDSAGQYHALSEFTKVTPCKLEEMEWQFVEKTTGFLNVPDFEPSIKKYIKFTTSKVATVAKFHVYFSDDGMNWGNTTDITFPEPITGAYSGMAHFDESTGQVLALLTITNNIYLFRSADMAQTWSAAQPIYTQGFQVAPHFLNKLSMSDVKVDPTNGNIYVALYADIRNGYIFSYAGFLRSLDNGATWSDLSFPLDNIANQTRTYGTYITLTDHAVLLSAHIYDTFSGTDGDIHIGSSYDQGATFSVQSRSIFNDTMKENNAQMQTDGQNVILCHSISASPELTGPPYTSKCHFSNNEGYSWSDIELYPDLPVDAEKNFYYSFGASDIDQFGRMLLFRHNHDVTPTSVWLSEANINTGLAKFSHYAKLSNVLTDLFTTIPSAWEVSGVSLNHNGDSRWFMNIMLKDKDLSKYTTGIYYADCVSQ